MRLLSIFLTTNYQDLENMALCDWLKEKEADSNFKFQSSLVFEAPEGILCWEIIRQGRMHKGCIYTPAHKEILVGVMWAKFLGIV